MNRWSDPARPNLLPGIGKVSEYCELRAMPDFGKYNTQLLVEAADTLGVHTSSRYGVECDVALWGTNPDTCKQLVGEVLKKMS